MIDPENITDYNLTPHELEEVLLFWICVAGKTARSIAPRLDNLLNSLEGISPFDKIKRAGLTKLSNKLKENGIGCYSIKAKSMWDLANSNLNLHTCTVDDLESIYGIGMKTARCFLIHSRPDSNCAGLDTHVLKFLRNMGHDVPKSTPGSKKKYKEIEQLFLDYANKSGTTVADFDLKIWNHYSRGEKYDLGK
jgi:thermostable 8-oxoguanine DNA glycosylase